MNFLSKIWNQVQLELLNPHLKELLDKKVWSYASLVYMSESDIVTLVKSGVDANCADRYKKSLLMCAAENNYQKAVRLLLDKGADVNHSDEEGRTVLMYAAQRSQADMCRLLIESGADVNTCKMDGVTALMLAAQAGEEKTVRTLINQGADIAAQDEHRSTALVWAIVSQKYNLDVMRTLIEAGVDVNRADKSGYTALHASLFFAGAETCRLLIESGADVNAVDQKGRTILTWAKEAHEECADIIQSEIIPVLIAHGATENQPNQPVQNAPQAETPNIQAVSIIRHEGCPISVQAKDRWRE